MLDSAMHVGSQEATTPANDVMVAQYNNVKTDLKQEIHKEKPCVFQHLRQLADDPKNQMNLEGMEITEPIMCKDKHGYQMIKNMQVKSRVNSNLVIELSLIFK